ncbi:protein adenylyltransferase SelO [Oceanospirillum maris]|uniref:protein adenylyltransferase SelO n=1 Tax=Oceanospirillum maris TaxID=64977 RepID=UPI00041C1DD0|nr:YdiU family protein [Oceanospirillum maris]
MTGQRTPTPLSDLSLQSHFQQLPDHHYQQVQPSPLRNPYLVSVNSDVAHKLGLDLCTLHPDELAEFGSGSRLFNSSQPIAMKYTGHQFGAYNPQLGDGRGLLLGEHLGPDGLLRDFHLKGAGKTAYSRFGDGRAVLRSSIREYLAGAAMAGLGIPTTEALCLVGSSDTVIRDGFPEPCATVLRVTPCHIRFGHFEHLYHSHRFNELQQLSQYVIDRYYPDCAKSDNPPLLLIRQIIQRSASLVAQWQAYGFVHGVMNTDNMSIIGETFDFGPFQFMDSYKADQVSNHSDHQSRYAFKRQPDIMLWNLFCLAQCFMPLVTGDGAEEAKTAQGLLEYELAEFSGYYKACYLNLMRQRLGLSVDPKQDQGDQQLIDELWRLLEAQQTDITLFFRLLSETPEKEQRHKLAGITTQAKAFEIWLDRYHQRLLVENSDTALRLTAMQKVNPIYLLRNYMAQEAIERAYQGDMGRVNELLILLRDPFNKHKVLEQYVGPAPQWASGISLSCSS